MEPTEVQAISESEPLAVIPAAAEAIIPAAVAPVATVPAPVPPAAMDTVSYVFALGRIEARYPSVAVEREFGQARARVATTGLTDQQALHALLQEEENRYLVRQLCWVLSIQDQDTYLLAPRDPMDLDLLRGAVRPVPRPTDMDAVIVVLGPVAPPEFCGGLTLPVVAFDQIMSFPLELFVTELPRPPAIQEERFRVAAEQLFSYIVRLPDNHGATNEHRALNYLALRYPTIYAQAARSFGDNLTLASVDVMPSRLNTGVREMVDVIFRFTNRVSGAMQRYFVRVDVTEEFPFVVSRLSPYFNR